LNLLPYLKMSNTPGTFMFSVSRPQRSGSIAIV